MKKKQVEKDFFEEKYFEGYYKKMVGDFSRDDLDRARKWFWGWLKALSTDLDVKHASGKKVLEIGCSIGGTATLLHDFGFEVVATDVSQYALDRAKKLSPEITYYKWDVLKPFPKKMKFDYVIGFEVIEHIDDPLKALKNIKDVLTPQGKVILSTPFPYNYVFLDPTHVSVKGADQWLPLFKKAGFKDVFIKNRSFIPFFYKFSKHFHFIMTRPFNTPYINSTQFIIAKK